MKTAKNEIYFNTMYRASFIIFYYK